MRSFSFILAIFFLVCVSMASAQYGGFGGYDPYAYYNQMAYNNYQPQPQYHSQAPSPQQQSEAPSTNWSMGSPAFAKASELFAMPKLI